MPTYEYKCNKCGYTFDILQSIKAEPLKTCSKCGKETLQKLISGGTGLIFKTKPSEISKTNGLPKKDKKEEPKSKPQKVTENKDTKSVSKTKKD